MEVTKFNKSLIMTTALAALLTIGGCAGMESSRDSSDPVSSAGIERNEPYFPTNFNDFKVPGELKQERKKSMFINTASFTGGILHFTGRVEINSLTDFFISSMQKNGWRMTGEVRYENIMLSFTKPNKNCMLTIYDGDFGTKTQVYVYITEEVTNSSSEQTL